MTKNLPAQLSPTLLQTVSDNTGLALKVVNQFSQWHPQQVRKIPPGVAALAIGNFLNQIAKQYGVREKPSDIVVKECISLVGLKFNDLAPDEILEAYRQWASGEIEVPKGGEMYGGQINARQLGAVLTAYSKARHSKIAKYLSEIKEEEIRERRQALNSKKKEAFNVYFKLALSEAIEILEDWREIPVFWYSVLEQRGEINLSPSEKRTVFDDAKELARMEEAERVTDKYQTKKIFQSIGNVDDIQIAIAKKLSVFRFYILKNRESIKNQNTNTNC